MTEQSLLLDVNENDIRIDKFLSTKFPEHSRTYFQYLLEQGMVFVNGCVAKKRILTSVGDKVEVHFVPTTEIKVKPEDIPLDILFEDEHIIAINKTSDIVVHPAPGTPNNTIVGALLYHCKSLPNVDDALRPGIVHRLDKETSGVLIAAKTTKAHRALVDAFKARDVEKTYLAVCISSPRTTCVDQPIGRHPVYRKKMCVKSLGKNALTHFEVLGNDREHSLVLCKPKTGRTHQIRVHLKYAGSPILGDSLYGTKSHNLYHNVSRQLLHAYQLSLSHPITGKKLLLTAPMPEDLNLWAHRLCPSFSTEKTL